jgi:hypothetical protein
MVRVGLASSNSKSCEPIINIARSDIVLDASEVPKINHASVVAAGPTVQRSAPEDRYLTNGDAVAAVVCCHMAAVNVKRMVKHDVTNQALEMIWMFCGVSFALSMGKEEMIITDAKLKATEIALRLLLTDNEE